MVTHVINHHPLSQSIAAPVTLVLVAFVAWASRAVGWRQLLVRSHL
ncbi:MAG TPA: hypothetical protein VK923_17760 [Euzebyales bacterium]|nr:hypothetical protein [Euzebyales bacterium]